MMRRPPESTLVPKPTPFRSHKWLERPGGGDHRDCKTPAGFGAVSWISTPGCARRLATLGWVVKRLRRGRLCRDVFGRCPLQTPKRSNAPPDVGKYTAEAVKQ